MHRTTRFGMLLTLALLLTLGSRDLFAQARDAQSDTLIRLGRVTFDPRAGEPVLGHLTGVTSEQPTELARMRREHGRRLPPGDRAQALGVRVQPVRVDQEGYLDPLRQRASELE